MFKKIVYIENNTWQNLYHTPYHPETPISEIGRGLILGVIQISPCIVVFIIYLNFLLRIDLFLFFKNMHF